MLIAFFHILFFMFVTLYPIIFNNRFNNLVYVLFFHSLLLSWILLDGECIFSLLYKKITIKDYVTGSKHSDLDDMYNLFESIDNVYKKFLILLFKLPSYIFLYFLYKSNKKYHFMNDNILFLVSFTYLLYLIYLNKFFNIKFFEKYDKYFRYFFKFIVVPFLLYNMYKIYQNL